MINYNIDIYLRHTEMEHMYVRELIELVTNDYNGNVFNFTIYDKDQVPYNLTGKTVTLIVKSELGTVIEENCTVDNQLSGTANITLPSDMFCENGTYYAEIQIWEGLNRITSLPFDYTVRLSLDSDEAVKADNRFSLLQQALQDVNDSNAIATQAKTTAENALATANQAATTIEGEIAKVDKAVLDANTALDRATNVVTQTELEAKATELDASATTKVNNKIGFNGVFDPTIFNFIDGKVVQENLIEVINKRVSGLYQISGLSVTNDFTLAGCIKNYNNTTLWHVPNVGPMRLVVDAASNKLIINGFEDKRILETAITPTIEFIIIKQGTSFIIYVNGVKAVTDLKYANEDTINKWNTNKFNFGYSNAILDVICTCNNKILTPQEIQHSFSVLNNTESIKSVTIGDKNYILASDTDHVQDRTGRTQEEINRTFYKRNCKEFTVGADDKIEVKNGEEGYVLSGEIKGQTIKNICKFSGVTESSDKITVYNTFVANNNNYSLKNFTDKPIFLQIYNVLGDTWVRNASVGVGQVINITSDEMIKTISGTFASGWSVNDKALLSSTCMIVPTSDISKVNSYIPFGLNSTQAIINNNGNLYPIYHPTELNEDGSKKVILCHKVGDVADTVQQLEDGSGVYTQNFKNMTFLNGTYSYLDYTNNRMWILTPSGTFKNSANGICDKYGVARTGYDDVTNRNKVYMNSNGDIRFVTDKTTTDISSIFPFTVIGELSTPTITTVDKAIMPTIATADKINICRVESPVAPSSFKLTLPVDRIGELEARLQAIEAKTNTQPVNLAFVDETYAKSINTIEEVNVQ